LAPDVPQASRDRAARPEGCCRRGDGSGERPFGSAAPSTTSSTGRRDRGPHADPLSGHLPGPVRSRGLTVTVFGGFSGAPAGEEGKGLLGGAGGFEGIGDDGQAGVTG